MPSCEEEDLIYQEAEERRLNRLQERAALRNDPVLAAAREGECLHMTGKVAGWLGVLVYVCVAGGSVCLFIPVVPGMHRYCIVDACRCHISLYPP